MANSPTNQNFIFDTELSLAATSFSVGVPVLIGTLENNRVMLLLKNLSNQTVFLSDNPGTTKGTTMVAGEEIILDCRANKGNASNGSFPINTSFYATATVGTGVFKISVIYAT